MRHHTPKSMSDRSIVKGMRLRGRQRRADQNRTAGQWRLGNSCGLQHRLHSRQFRRRTAREEMVQSKHAMSLAATEIRLKLHHRITALPTQSLQRARQEHLQTFGQVRAAEELDGVAVLITSLSTVNLAEVCRELCLLIAARGHIRVRRDHFAPRL